MELHLNRVDYMQVVQHQLLYFLNNIDNITVILEVLYLIEMFPFLTRRLGSPPRKP